MADVVVVGGSVCGLLTAYALAQDGHSVTVLERDDAPLPATADHAFDEWNRRGAPQVRHSHALLARLRNLLRDRAPALLGDLLDAGATELRFVDTPPPELGRLEPEDGDEDLVALACRRLTFEWVLRRAVEAEPLVTVRTGAVVSGLVTSTGAIPTVHGVVLTSGEKVLGDLTVDAAGRRSPLASWLADAGAGAVPTDEADCGLVYLSRFYRLRNGERAPDGTGVIGADLGYVKYAVFPGDNDCFSVTIGLRPGDDELRQPLLTAEGFDAAARALPSTAPWVDPGLAAPITTVQVMAGLRNTRRRFVVDGRPLARNIYALGDAAVHTNPLYGRGCSLAAVHAFAFADALCDVGKDDPDALALNLDSVTRRELDPWYDAAVMQDRGAVAAFGGDSEAASPGNFVRDGLMAAARRDPQVFRAFVRVLNLLTPPNTLIQDVELAARVLTVWNEREARPPIVDDAPDRDAMIALLTTAV
ncbi:MAG TPA: FAD-dependent oxidoreductase [Acidimicrobiales bacterium]|nr:FAD-dependent oxidoreductase [Acidimicrobiales bacterium]